MFSKVGVKAACVTALMFSLGVSQPASAGKFRRIIDRAKTAVKATPLAVASLAGLGVAGHAAAEEFNQGCKVLAFEQKLSPEAAAEIGKDAPYKPAIQKDGQGRLMTYVTQCETTPGKGRAQMPHPDTVADAPTGPFGVRMELKLDPGADVNTRSTTPHAMADYAGNGATWLVMKADADPAILAASKKAGVAVHDLNAGEILQVAPGAEEAFFRNQLSVDGLVMNWTVPAEALLDPGAWGKGTGGFMRDVYFANGDGGHGMYQTDCSQRIQAMANNGGAPLKTVSGAPKNDNDDPWLLNASCYVTYPE